MASAAASVGAWAASGPRAASPVASSTTIRTRRGRARAQRRGAKRRPGCAWALRYTSHGVAGMCEQRGKAAIADHVPEPDRDESASVGEHLLEGGQPAIVARVDELRRDARHDQQRRHAVEIAGVVDRAHLVELATHRLARVDRFLEIADLADARG